MVRILIGYSGSGKTYKLKEEIAHKEFGGITNAKEIYIIEREEHQEYSNIFGGKYIHVLKPSSDISFLSNIENSEIYVDCENYENEFMQKIVDIVKKAKTHNNDITITFLHFLDDWDGTFFPVKYNNEKLIFENTDEILIGKCISTTEQSIENLLGIRLRPVISNYEFRNTKYDRLEDPQIIHGNFDSLNVTTDKTPFKICNILCSVKEKLKRKDKSVK